MSSNIDRCERCGGDLQPCSRTFLLLCKKGHLQHIAVFECGTPLDAVNIEIRLLFKIQQKATLHNRQGRPLDAVDFKGKFASRV